MSSMRFVLFVFTLGMLCAFAPMCTDMYLPALPSVMLDYGCSASLVQISLSASFLGLSIGQIFIGPLSDVYGRKLPLFVSLVLFALSSVLCAVSSDIYTFIGARLLQGMAASGGIVLSRSIACDKFRGNELTSFMAFFMSIHSIAPILAPVIGSAILTFMSWRVIFSVLCIWGVMLIFFSKFFVQESLSKQDRAVNISDSLARMKLDIFNLKFMLSAVSLSCVMGGFFSYLAASPFIFENIYSFTPFEYSLSFGFIAVCMALSSLSVGKIARRTGELVLVLFAFAVMTVSALILLIQSIYVPDSFIPVMISLTVFCSMMALSQAAGFSIVMDSRKGGAGAAAGIFGVMHFIIGVLVTPFVGILGEKSMLPLAVNMLVCALLAAFFMRFSRSV